MRTSTMQGGASANALDDPKLLARLISQAKSSHSNLGRSLDTSLSYRKVGGGTVEPSAMSVNRQERQRQLHLQKQQQEAWRQASQLLFNDGAAVNSEDARSSRVGRAASPDTAAQTTLAGTGTRRITRSAPSSTTAAATTMPLTHTRTLVVPALATVAPSFTKAADDGVDELGGTRLGGTGYASRVAVVPTEHTIACLADEDELISSFRPYQHDALAAARQAATREISAPHPDLLRQLEPTLNAVAPHKLVDTGAIPEALLSRQRQLYAYQVTGAEEEEEGEAPAGAQASFTRNIEDTVGVGRANAREGTYPFLAVGRDRGVRRLPGHRQPAVGQYSVRYGEIESRVTGGYIQPQLSAGGTSARRRDGEADGEVAETTEEAAERPMSTALENGNTSFYSTIAAPHNLGTGVGAEPAAVDYPPGYQPGDNVKGSSMFVSATSRTPPRGTAAPDTCYWPYPDVRSTSRRVPEPVRMGVPTHHRRREPAVSGVPTGMYDVAGDLAKGQHNSVQMARTPGRDAHWYGKTDLRVQGSADPVNVDKALRATRPHERVATLPPRISKEDEDEERQRTAEVVDTSVSVERNLNYPRHAIGEPERLTHVRAFGTMLSRDERDRVKGGASAHAGAHDAGLYYEPEVSLVEKRQQSAVIHPRAPGHGEAIGARDAGELGEIPNLKWTRPNNARGTQFGAGSRRPDHLLAMHDLSYNTEPGYRLIGPHVGGDPMIGSVVSRQKREKVFSTNGSGPETGAVYMAEPLPAKVKSVPDFARQITKETQFAGHRVVSERYERTNPKAPGPGFYDVSYVQVDKHEAATHIQ